MSTLKEIRKKIYKSRHYYYLLIPATIYFIIFHYIPIWGVTLSFQKFRIFGGNEWVGFKYFQELFSSPTFYRSLTNTLIISGLKVLIGFPIPVIIALMMNSLRNKHYKKYVRSVIYMPHFLSWVVITGVFAAILSPVSGMVNEIIKLFGMDPIPFMTSGQHFRGVLVISEIWRSSGWDSILYTAALMNIDKILYEAASIDGASAWQQTLKITLPELIRTMVTVFILNIGFFMNAGFDQVFNMMNDSVISVADIIDTYAYRIGLLNNNYSYATAVGLFQGVIGLILVIVTNKVAKKIEAGSLW
ncbi:MAG TPA: ABC transporter permease subunit [Thermotogota bacterium]|nr:ABC transporter permease subunit [Thermotogota bacterium]HPJ90003.1 ABC transporter permease subunit [Thermotogota bacterium]HPR97057.1 ABC transporter permease subunit [Thermotogota bacterium]